MVDLTMATTKQLLKELEKVGGHPGAVASAVLLCVKKSEDYNHGKGEDPHFVDRSNYFPFGLASYAHMIHTKSQRIVTLVQKQQSGKEVNFEGLRDTALDIINYAGFYIEAEDKGDFNESN